MTTDENITSSKAPRRAGTGYGELLRGNPNFRFLWFGQIVSLFGDWFNLIASAALLAELTESGLAIGGLFVVRMLAPFLVSPLAGVLADRYNRKHLLIISDLVRAFTVVGFLLVRSPQQVWLLFLLTALQLGVSGVFFPTRNAILPDIVSKQELGAANALTSATWSVMLAVGSALGGLATGLFGIYPAFLVVAATFLLSAACLAQIVYLKAGREERVGRTVGDAFREHVQGLRFLKEHPDILWVSLHKGALGLSIAGGAANVMMVTVSENLYRIGEGGAISLGIIFTVVGLGTGLGPIWIRRWTGDREWLLRIAIAGAYAVGLFGILLAAQFWSYGAFLTGMFLRALGVGVVWVFSTQLLLQALPDDVRGRVFATEFALHTLASAASAGVGGWLVDSSTFDLSGLLYGMGVLGLIPGVLWSVWLVIRSAEWIPDKLSKRKIVN